MGNGSVIRPGDVQRMSAGTGVMHSEFNHEKAGETHFLQIWIQPDRRGTQPGYEEKHFSPESKRGMLRLVGSQDGRDGSVRIQQDVSMYAGLFNGDEAASLKLDPARQVYLHVARGEINANGTTLQAGDALMLNGESALELSAGHDAEVIVFDLN
jgi:redox-sensitive bicupin YhaK (pirin superfamily)